jgi:hypothetical protein
LCGHKYAQFTTYRKDGTTVDVQLCGLIHSPSVDLDDSTGKSIKSDANDCGDHAADAAWPATAGWPIGTRTHRPRKGR